MPAEAQAVERTVAENFREYLLAVPDIYELVGDRVHQDHVPGGDVLDGPSEVPGPYIWFSLSGVEREGCLNDDVGEGPDTYLFDLECWAGQKSYADRIAAAVMRSHGYMGLMGQQNVQSIWFEDQADDYLPQGMSSAGGMAETSMSVEIGIVKT